MKPSYIIILNGTSSAGKSTHAKFLRAASSATSPDRALELGLVNAVVSHKLLLLAARMLLERILVHSPLATRRCHYPHRGHAGHHSAIAEGLAVEAEQFARIAPTADLREGPGAWIARRARAYPGTLSSVVRS